MWLRLDDRFPEDPAVASVGLAGRGLFVDALAYANRNATDGWVPECWAVRQAEPDEVRPLIAALVNTGLWIPEKRSGIDGFRMRQDIVDLQLTKAQAEERRQKRAEAGHLGGIASGKTRRAKRSQSKPGANAEALALGVASPTAKQIESKPEPGTGTGSETEERVPDPTERDRVVPRPEDLVAVWNRVRGAGPKIDQLTPQRRNTFGRALKAKPDLAEWEFVIGHLDREAWANAPGTGDHPNWRATLDWLVKPGKLQQWLERAKADLAGGGGKGNGNGRVAPTPGKYAESLKDEDE